MSKLVSEQPKVAVIFENTAFGTSTSNGLKELAPGEGVEIVMFEPYSAGFTDASPLINKVKASRRQRAVLGLLPQRPHPDRTDRQAGRAQHRDQRRVRRLCHSGFLQERRQARRGPAGRGALEPRHGRERAEGERRIQEAHRRLLFEYAGGLVAQTFMIADALERAGSAEPQKVREALSALDVSSGFAAMAPGGKVKFGPDGKNVYGRPVGVQWQNGDLASVSSRRKTPARR